LISDPRNEELNRGYAFLELTTHNDAIKAFVRLRKPDATFGYNRSVKVSWAEPLLDEDSLAKVVLSKYTL
jgi:glutaredoxin-related protein